MIFLNLSMVKTSQSPVVRGTNPSPAPGGHRMSMSIPRAGLLTSSASPANLSCNGFSLHPSEMPSVSYSRGPRMFQTLCLHPQMKLSSKQGSPACFKMKTGHSLRGAELQGTSRKGALLRGEAPTAPTPAEGRADCDSPRAHVNHAWCRG